MIACKIAYATIILCTSIHKDGGVLSTLQQAEQERDSEGKEAGVEQKSEEVAGNEQEASGTTGTGVWKKLKQRLQRNTQDIKLVSGAIL